MRAWFNGRSSQLLSCQLGGREPSVGVLHPLVVQQRKVLRCKSFSGESAVSKGMLKPSTARHQQAAVLIDIDRVPEQFTWSFEDLNIHVHEDDDTTVLISVEKIKELAELAHIRIEETEIERLRRDVQAIIRCTKTIQDKTGQRNVSQVYNGQAYATGVYAAPIEADEVTEGNCVDQIVRNARIRQGNHFSVPKVLDD